MKMVIKQCLILKETLNVGGTIKYLGGDFKIVSIKSEKTKIENVSSVLLEVTY